MRLNNNTFAINNLIKLKDHDWLEKQRIAGKVAAGALSLLEKLIQEKSSYSLIELNNIAEDYIIKNKCSCTFKNYKGFPTGVCISVNKQLVHGIPTNYKLQNGDLVSFDLGATFEGAIADSAITCIYGEPKSELHVKLVKTTEESLLKGIEVISVGKRLGCIGNAIYRYAKGSGFGVITNYGGHGLDWNVPHAPPFVNNKSNLDEGIRIQPGLSIAIEPLLVIGSISTEVSHDKWTVNCKDICSHFEHTIYVHEDHVEIISWRENDKAHLPTNKIYFK